MTICNRQHTYSEKNYTKKKGKRKRNDYTMKYNAKMSNNMEMKTVNIKRKGENCIDYKKK